MSDLTRDARADALLNSLGEQAISRLKIFLGAAPGVGKSYAMLMAARELKRQGVDVVVGLIETHGRPETEGLLDGLEVLPRRYQTYRERSFSEFDLDAALQRRPAVLLVDELAHRNVPGGRHERRWQDIAELLDAGIEVYTALNVQHVESLNDQVKLITGIVVRETVPDAFLDRARDIVLVDLPPRELIARLRQGKVYLPEAAKGALAAFFSPGNLAALRDLSVNTIAAHVDSDLREHMLAKGSAMPVRRRVMAVIDGDDQSGYLVRVARRIAERRGGPWSVVFVDRGRAMEPIERQQLEAAMRLARQLGGDAVVLPGDAVADELLAYAEREGIGQILLGRSHDRPLARWFGQSLTQQLLRRGSHLELTIIATPSDRAVARRRLRLAGGRGTRGEYLHASLVTLIAFALAFMADRYLAVGNLALIFLPAVLVVAVRSRMAVAVYTAIMCFLGYNFFFAPPRYSLSISSPDDVLAVVMFLASALLCSRLATRLSIQVAALRQAHAHAGALLALGQRLSSSTDAKGIREVGAAALVKALRCDVALLVRDNHQAMQIDVAMPREMQLTTQDLAAADWSQRHAEPAGRYTNTLNAAPCWVLPLGADNQALGAVALRFGTDEAEPSPERRSLALAMVQDIGQALQRDRLAQELEGARVEGETERLRNVLLSSVSHDLRSPLASMIGAAGTLLSYADELPAGERQELFQSILSEGQRLDRYIQNLLDMTRLGHDQLALHRDWIGAGEIVTAAIERLRKFVPGQIVSLAPDQPIISLYVHPALIEQALFNILENAAKFSPPGQAIEVSMSLRTSSRQLRIEVRDHGPGIPEEQRAQIFDMFYSVARGDSGRPSTGMGLAICRGMIGAHGGSVEALPADDGGTVIRVTLPLPASPDEPES